MKKLLFSALILSLAIACQEMDSAMEPAVSGNELYASIESVDATKTSMDQFNNILWSEGDEIIGFMQTTLGTKYLLDDEYIGSTTGGFVKAAGTGDKDRLETGQYIEHNVLMYPYSSGTKCLKNDSETPAKSYRLTIDLPETQSYQENSFGKGSFPMTAVSADNQFTFRNICGGVKLRLKGSASIKSITLEGLSEEGLSGKADVTAYVDGSAPAITMAASANTSVTLDCNEGVQLHEDLPVTFIITVPPVEFSSGMKITINDTDGSSKTLTNTASNKVKRSCLLTFPVITYEPEAEEEFPTNPEEFALIDLGLKVKWANWNMGADSPYSSGKATAWGHEEGKDVYYPTGMNISGSKYDLVKKELGGEWRLPTAFDFMELEQKCSWKHLTINGVSGNLITGPNGNRIFLPDAIYWTGTARERSTDDHDYLYGIYWTPEGVAASNSKYNRPVQGAVRTYPEVTLTVNELGKTTAKVTAEISDYASFGIDLGLNLTVSAAGSIKITPADVTNGKYIYEISGLSSNYQYTLQTSFNIEEWSVKPDARQYIKTLAVEDGDGLEAEPVDVGLSVKWAKWNLGASCRNDKGLKLYWGGISINDETRYDLKDMDITGTQYDPATALWGQEWRLPTMAEWRELVGSYYRDQYSVNATGGVLLKESIFLPEDAITQYMSGQYGYGCYFLMYSYCYASSFNSLGSRMYVRPVYDPMAQLDMVTVVSSTSDTAVLTSGVIRIGGSDVSEKGFVYSTSASPSLETAKSIQADSNFSAELSGLEAGTTYYVRAYAVNSHGTSYGEECTFTTVE